MLNIQSDIDALLEHAWDKEVLSFMDWFGTSASLKRLPAADEEDYKAALAAFIEDRTEVNAVRLAQLGVGHVFCSMARLGEINLRPTTCAVGRLEDDDNVAVVFEGHLDLDAAMGELVKTIHDAYPPEYREGREVYTEAIIRGYNLEAE